MIVIYELEIGPLRRKRKYSWTTLMNHTQRLHGGSEEKHENVNNYNQSPAEIRSQNPLNIE
jgi:hypothetical protein